MQDYGFENLLSVLKKAGDIEIESRVKTFFDVTGFPHYENVISNILAFFFDTNEEHGFKDLWLKSLFECYNSVANTHFQLGEFEEIERELTDAGFKSWTELQEYMLPTGCNKIVPNPDLKIINLNP